jgi:hypothetical protein
MFLLRFFFFCCSRPLDVVAGMYADYQQLLYLKTLLSLFCVDAGALIIFC